MAAQIGSMYVGLTADLQPFASAFSRAEAIATRTQSRIERSFASTERSAVRLNRAYAGAGASFKTSQILGAARAFENAGDRVGLLRGALLSTTAVFGGFTAALSSNIILRYADTVTNLKNQILAVSGSAGEMEGKFAALNQVASGSRATLESTAKLYSRIQKAAPTKSAGEVLQYVQTIQKALVLGGATAQEANSAAIQLSQALASDRLGGEELRAILETPLGQALADGLGITIGKLRELSQAGKITAKEVFRSLENVGPSVEVQFSKSIRSLDQALVVADNNITSYVGSINEAYGITKLLGDGVVGLSENLDGLADILGLVALAGSSVFSGRALASITGGPIRALKEAQKQRKETIVQLEAIQTAQQEEVVTKGISRSEATRKTFGDQKQYADKSAINEYKRALIDVQKLDATQIKNNAALAAAKVSLGQITSRSSVAAVRAADAIIAQEKRVLESYQAQGVQIKNLEKARANAIVAAAQATLGRGSGSTVARAETGISSQEKKLADARLRVVEQEAALQQRVAALSSLRSKADQDSASRRLTALRQINSLEYANNKLMEDRKLTADVLRAINADIYKNGALKTAGDLDAATVSARSAVNALGKTNAKLIAMQGGSTRTSQAIGLLRGGFSLLRGGLSSLIGFMGGPWGVALAAVVGGLALWGRTAAETAAAIDRSMARIEARTKSAGKNTSKQYRIVAVNGELQTLVSQLKDDQTHLQTVLDPTKSIAFVGNGRWSNTRAINDLIQAVKDGIVPVSEFADRLKSTGASALQIQKVRNYLADAGSIAFAAADSVAELKAQINSLESKKVTIQAEVIFDDKNFNDRFGPSPKQARLTNADLTLQQQYASYGQGQQGALNAGRLQQSLDNGLQGAIGNTDVALQQLTQQIFEANKALGITYLQAGQAAKAQQAASIGAKSMLDLIGYAEGTDKGRGYNETLGYGAYTGGDKNLVGMTLKEIVSLQRQMLAHPDNKFNSSALGRYQITKRTLQSLMGELGLSGDETFDPAMQDRMAQQLLRRRQGQGVAGLRNEWEGLRNIEPGTISSALNGTAQTLPAQDENLKKKQEETAKLNEEYAKLLMSMGLEKEATLSEIALMGASALEREKQRLFMEKINSLKSAGVPLDATRIAKIREETAAQAALNIQQKDGKESLEKMQASADAFRAGAKGIFGSFLSDLRQGKSLTEALKGAFDKLLDKVLEMAGNGLLDALFGGQGSSTGTGLLGGLMKGIMSLFGVGYSSGGYTGGGSRKGAAGVVHGQEYVVNAKQTSKFRPLLEAINSGKARGYANGGFVSPVSSRGAAFQSTSLAMRRMSPSGSHITFGVSADNNGNLMPFVEKVSSRVSNIAVHSGLSAYDRNMTSTMDVRMQQAQADRI